MVRFLFTTLLFLMFLFACSSSDSVAETMGPTSAEYKILSLGDSYTIGESVSVSGSFPVQLSNRLKQQLNEEIFLKVVARTGWTTSDLKSAINSENLRSDYDLVTLLIGVNNQFQSKPFSLYEQEFTQLLDKAISFAKGDNDRVIVVSIPDYAFTPFGQSSSNPNRISTEIDRYNNFAKSLADSKNVSFINITDITRRGLSEPDLVASDGLHPSKVAYEEFVDLIYPLALDKIQQ